MKRLMCEADIAVSAGGQTVYELARTGTPAVVVAVADNQLKGAAGWDKAGAARFAGRWDSEDLNGALTDALTGMEDPGIRQHMALAGQSLVDGKGSERIRDYMLQKSSSTCIR